MFKTNLKKWSLSPGSHLSKHVERITKYAKIRAGKAKTPEFKLYRHTLQKIVHNDKINVKP